MPAQRPRPARAEPPASIALPRLTAFAGASVEDRADYEALAFTDLDLAGQSAVGATFTDCRLDRCRLDGLGLARARFGDTLLRELEATDLDATDTTWRDSLVDGGRIGALGLSGATLTGVRLRGLKLDFVDLSHARLDGVWFVDCAVGELELAEAELRGVRFEGSSIETLSAGSARFTDVDLTGARLRTIADVASLRGATISPEQLVDVAPLLAAQLGIRVGHT
jgi:uncharacterized protein YjbI with pentapeptide repeats